MYPLPYRWLRGLRKLAQHFLWFLLSCYRGVFTHFITERSYVSHSEWLFVFLATAKETPQ